MDSLAELLNFNNNVGAEDENVRHLEGVLTEDNLYLHGGLAEDIHKLQCVSLLNIPLTYNVCPC
jgi:hypothetical protein